MRRLMILGFLLSPISSALAQERGTELGLVLATMGVTRSGGESFFHFQANQVGISAALYTSPSVAIEPAAVVSVVSGGGATLAQLQLGVSVPIYTSRAWGHSGLYVAPGAGVQILSADVSGIGETASQFSVGLEVGTKIPILDPVSVRVAGNLGYGFETDTIDDVFGLSGQLGISVFFN